MSLCFDDRLVTKHSFEAFVFEEWLSKGWISADGMCQVSFGDCKGPRGYPANFEETERWTRRGAMEAYYEPSQSNGGQGGRVSRSPAATTAISATTMTASSGQRMVLSGGADSMVSVPPFADSTTSMELSLTTPCNETCTAEHIKDGPCLACGSPWGAPHHRFHECKPGQRGSWRVPSAMGLMQALSQNPFYNAEVVEHVNSVESSFAWSSLESLFGTRVGWCILLFSVGGVLGWAGLG